MIKSSINIKNLSVFTQIGNNYWRVKNPVPLGYRVDVSMMLRPHVLQKSGHNDDLDYSISYADVSNSIVKFCTGREFPSHADLVAEVHSNLVSAGIANFSAQNCSSVSYAVADNKFHLKLQEYKLQEELSLEPGTETGVQKRVVCLRGLRLLTKIGIFDFERLKKQYVSLDMTVNEISYDQIESLASFVESREFLTIEALIIAVDEFLRVRGKVQVLDLSVNKLNAVLSSSSVGLEIRRDSQVAAAELSGDLGNHRHTVYLSVGSNLGNPVENIYNALQHLQQDANITVLQTSTLYETTPMYYTAQDKFVNGALKISTKYAPHELLKVLKDIEYGKLGRVKKQNNGPRTIDLDILLYDNEVMSSEALQIPHAKMLERQFVLEPLCELVDSDSVHPVTLQSFHDVLQKVSTEQFKTVFPMGSPSSKRVWSLDFSRSKTLVMGILNRTQNSFSDAGKNYDLENAVKAAEEMVENGADILDIGATSTKPGVDINETSPEQEIALIVPLVHRIRSHTNPKLRDVVISIDTFFSKTALKAVEAGADIVNDISMGMYDPEMYSTVARLKVPYIMNHTRGTPLNMTQLTDYSTSTSTSTNVELLSKKTCAVMDTVNLELAQCISDAYAAGVCKWQIILDPGLGFAKTRDQNLQVIKHSGAMREFRAKIGDNVVSYANMPLLLGPSKKRFISEVTKTALDAAGTNNVVMACIGNGTNIVRVHDVASAKKACLLGDAIYRIED